MSPNVSRRQILGFIGASAFAGCSGLSSSNNETTLPILVAVELANATDQQQTFKFRVKRADTLDEEPKTVTNNERTVAATSTVRITHGWAKTPGDYALEYKVGAGDWTQSNITARLTQREQICYERQIQIDPDEDTNSFNVTTVTNVDAPCPEE